MSAVRKTERSEPKPNESAERRTGPKQIGLSTEQLFCGSRFAQIMYRIVGLLWCLWCINLWDLGGATAATRG